VSVLFHIYPFFNGCIEIQFNRTFSDRLDIKIIFNYFAVFLVHL